MSLPLFLYSDDAINDIDLDGLTFGEADDADSRLAFFDGWNYRSSHKEEPSAKELGLYPNSQVLRIDFERGWLAADAARRLLTKEVEDQCSKE